MASKNGNSPGSCYEFLLSRRYYTLATSCTLLTSSATFLSSMLTNLSTLSSTLRMTCALSFWTVLVVVAVAASGLYTEKVFSYSKVYSF